MDEDLLLYCESHLQGIKEECVKMFKDAITDAVYNVYDPTFFPRTHELRDSVVGEIKEGVLYVYIDVSKLNYTSWVNFVDTGKSSSYLVPWLVQMGHKDDSGIDNAYHLYNGRDYLTRAKDYVEARYGIQIEVEIINNNPYKQGED